MSKNKSIILVVIVLFSTAFNSGSSNTKLNVKATKLAEQIEPKMIEWRHYFHEHPELSNREYKTSEYIAEHLRKLGLDVQTGIAHTGVVAILKGDKAGPVVALRADMDALPVLEPEKLSWKSNEIGNYQGEEVPVMHACGHDTHMAILMATAEVLTSLKSELKGTVKFIFQPAEEGPPEGENGGAKMMVEEGVLKNPDAEVIFGLHINADMHIGNIGYKPGGAMASSNHFEIKIKGKQAHGGTPWKSIDPIVTAAQIINNVQTIVSRNMPLVQEAAVVSFGSVHGGVRHNIIPEEVVLTGTIRALNEDMRQLIFKRLQTIVENTAESNGASASLTIHEAALVTYNDPELVKKMLPSLEGAVGQEHLLLKPAVTPAEDFSYFQKEIPGFYFWLGGAPLDIPESETAPHHTPNFYVDDAGMIYGVKAMSRLVIDYMEMK